MLCTKSIGNTSIGTAPTWTTSIGTTSIDITSNAIGNTSTNNTSISDDLSNTANLAEGATLKRGPIPERKTAPLQQEAQTPTQGVLRSMVLPKGLRHNMQIQIGFAGLSRTPTILNNPHLTLLGLLRAHEANGYLNMLWRCPALQDPVLRQTYIWLVQHGWLPRMTLQSPPLTRAALVRILTPSGKRDSFRNNTHPTIENPRNSLALGLETPRNAHQWYLSRDQRNTLMKAYNGNTATSYCSTTFPHTQLPTLAEVEVERFLRTNITIATHNGCTLKPNPVLMGKLMTSTPRKPDIVVLPESHQTPHTIKEAKGLWKAQQLILHTEDKSSRANAASGVGIATASNMAACKIVSHDPLGRHLALRIPMAEGWTILLIGIYAPQKPDKKGRTMLADQILRLLEMAFHHRYQVILTGDWNDIQDPEMDQHPLSQETHPPDPWFADIIHNPYMNLYDPWRLHCPNKREFTYFHRGDQMRDRKDFTLVSAQLLPCVTWQTNAMWPVDPNKGGHSALASMTINLDPILEKRLETPARAPTREQYLDHSHQEEWSAYKRIIGAQKPHKWKDSPSAQRQKLLNVIEQAKQEAEVVIPTQAAEPSRHPYQNKRIKHRVKVINRCNEILRSDFATRPQPTKMIILRDIQEYLDPRTRRAKERMIRRTAQTNFYLPELWKTQIPQIRRQQARLLKQAADRDRQVAHDRFRERIHELAENRPGHLLGYIKANSTPPTSVAITADGKCLTTAGELDKEAQKTLKPVMAPEACISPMGQPDTEEINLLPHQRQHRLAFQTILEQFGPRTTTAQKLSLKSIMRHTTVPELRDALRKIKRSSYAPGLPMVLLKELPDRALHPLSNIINAILDNPEEMTEDDLLAHMVLFPKDDPWDLSKVRPITMCSALYKVVAYIISSRIMTLLETDSFLLTSNVGFTPHGETHHLIMAIQAMFDVNQTKPAPHREHLHALMVDLTQAYDRVPWQALIQTLEHIGFPPIFQQWLLRALGNTTIYLKFPQGLAEEPLPFRANRGIKQGCPLSPILFAIFNDTLLRWIASATPSSYLDDIPTTLGYADDMAFISAGSEEQIRTQVTLLNLWEKWTDQGVNSSKTKILSTDMDGPWEIVNESSPTKECFQKVNTFKYLGVIIHAIATRHRRDSSNKNWLIHGYPMQCNGSGS
jgi:exonuclease III